MHNNHVTYIVAVWLDFSLFSWLWRQRECQTQVATHVRPTESLTNWEGFPGDLFSGLQCSKSKLVFRYERPDLFLLNFLPLSCKIIPGPLLFFHSRTEAFLTLKQQLAPTSVLTHYDTSLWLPLQVSLKCLSTWGGAVLRHTMPDRTQWLSTDPPPEKSHAQNERGAAHQFTNL